MFSLFSTPKRFQKIPFGADMHSHLLPGLDDGVKSLQEAKEIILLFQEMGYEKAITTPHIMSDTYRNTPEIIRKAHGALVEFLKTEKIDFEVEAAAEYYLDEPVLSSVELKKELLTFGDQYVLFETNYLTEPYTLKEFIFKATTQGYKLVLAHPERYHYMTLAKAEDLFDRGVLFQINLLSLTGYYSRPVQRMAERFIDKGWIHFLGTDCHNAEHVRQLQKIFKSRYFKKALDLPLLNASLLS